MMRTSTLGVESLTQEQYEVFGDCENIWRHNIFWSLMALECKLFTLPNSYVAESEIMDMVRQYGSLFKRYYSGDTANKLSAIVNDYCTLYLNFLKDIGNQHGVGTCPSEQKWIATGGALAKLFSELNDFWQEREWRAMITHQMEILCNEARSTAAGAYGKMPFNYDVLDSMCTEMSNYMALGLIRQFQI